MTESLGYMLFALGSAYLIALFVARIIIKWHIPRVTGYLLVGLLVGPSLSQLLGYPALISSSTVRSLEFLSEFALALIMFTIGGQFRADQLRRWGKRLTIQSSTEIGVTFAFVSLAAFLTNLFAMHKVFTGSNGVLGSSSQIAIFIGIIAVATAPAATLLVIREFESSGPVTDISLTLVGLNNLISIFSFNVATYFLLQDGLRFYTFLLNLIAPILMAIVFGFVVSTWAQKLESDSELQLLILGSLIIYVGLTNMLHYDMFLGCLIGGIMVANASPKADRLFDAIRKIDYPIYVIFFILAGAALHIAALPHLGLFGLAYIFMRFGGKLIGNWLGAMLAGFGNIEKKWIGYTMMAQAGVAIGLSHTLNKIWPEGGGMVQTVILGSVVVFELIGPIAVRHGLVHAGEVPILTLLAKKAPEGPFEGLHHVVEYFRSSIGIPVGHKIDSPADILVKHVMRKNVETICENTPFNEILRLISHSKYDRFPVVNAENDFVGVIDYRDIRDVIFDDALSHFIVAKDLTTPESLVVRENQTLGEVLKIFQEHSNISYLPVVDEHKPERLTGIISQNDVLAAFRRRQIKEN